MTIDTGSNFFGSHGCVGIPNQITIKTLCFEITHEDLCVTGP